MKVKLKKIISLAGYIWNHQFRHNVESRQKGQFLIYLSESLLNDPRIAMTTARFQLSDELWPLAELSSAAPAEPEARGWRNEARWGRSPADAQCHPPPRSWAATCRRHRRPETKEWGNGQRKDRQGEQLHELLSKCICLIVCWWGGWSSAYLFDRLALGDLRVSDHLVWRTDLNEGELRVLCNLSRQGRLSAVGWAWERRGTMYCLRLCSYSVGWNQMLCDSSFTIISKTEATIATINVNTLAVHFLNLKGVHLCIEVTGLEYQSNQGIGSNLEQSWTVSTVLAKQIDIRFSLIGTLSIKVFVLVYLCSVFLCVFVLLTLQ